MAFDFKKEYKEFYLPAKTPSLVEIPPMNYLAVRGRGNPNQEGGAYHQALELLYGMAYTIKMSYKGPRSIEGFFAYVVPPLEGLWWQEGPCGIHPARKEDFHWISLIRLPDFVQRPDFEWAAQEAAGKRSGISPPLSFSRITRGCACSVCTWAPMTTNLPPSLPWATLQRRTDTSVIWLQAGTTMKSTSATREKRRPTSSKP